MSNFYPAQELHLRDLQALSDRVDDVARRAAPGNAGGGGKGSGIGGVRLAPRFLPFDVILAVNSGGVPVLRILGGTIRDASGVWTVGTPGQWGSIPGIDDPAGFTAVWAVQQVNAEGTSTGWTLATAPGAGQSILIAEYTAAPGSAEMRVLMQHIHGDIILSTVGGMARASQIRADFVTDGSDTEGSMRAARYARAGEAFPQIVDGVMVLPPLAESGGGAELTLADQVCSDMQSAADRAGIVSAVRHAGDGETAPQIVNGVILIPQYSFDPEYFDTCADGVITLKAAPLEALADEVAKEIRLEVTVNGILANDGGTEYTDSIGKIGLDTTGDGTLDTVIAETQVRRA